LCNMPGWPPAAVCWLYLRLFYANILPCRLPKRKVDFRFGFVGFNVLSVLTVVLELLRLSLVFYRPTAVEFVDSITFFAPRSS